MGRAGKLYPLIAEHDHLLATFHRERCGNQDRSAVQSFAANQPAEIAAPRQELLAEHVH